MASMLTCEICLETKSDRKPKSLNCLHSFCRECLASWIDTRQMRTDVECPVCRQHTRIPAGGIDGLVDDFKVLQLEEMMKTIGDPFICQGCLLKGQSSRAVSKCLTCDRRLCEVCYRNHSARKIFEKHQVVTDLCDVHGNDISHVCVTCFTGLCVDCILSDIHDSHEMYELDEGICKLQDSVVEKKKQVCDLRKQTEAKLRNTEERTRQSVELNIEKLKRSAEAMKQEIDRQVTELIKRYSTQSMKELQASHNAFEEQYLPKTLDKLIKQDDKGNMKDILDCNTALNQEIRQIRDAEQHVPVTSVKTDIDRELLKNVGTHISLQQYYDKIETSNIESLLKETFFKDISDTPKLVFEKLSEDCDHIGLPRGLEIMDGFSVLVAFDERDRVIRFGKNGKVLAMYHCDGEDNQNKVNCVTVNNGNIYILCWDNQRIIRVRPGGFSSTDKYLRNKPSAICSLIYNPNNNTLILSDFPPDGKVFRCHETNMSTEECSMAPGNIRVLPYAGSYRIVVASYKTNTVNVYNQDEKLLYTLKGCGDDDPFNQPTDVGLLGYDTLLVADQCNHRICKFKLSDGTFNEILLNKANGIECPLYIACKYPYLWVTGRWEKGGNSYGSLQLYKWS